MEDFMESVTFRLALGFKADAQHGSSQKLWQHAQGLRRFKQDKVPVLHERCRHDLPSLFKNLSPIDNCL